MALRGKRVVSIAVASNRVGMVYLVDGELMDWEYSSTAAQSQVNAGKKASEWIEFYCPDLVITERVHPHSRKSDSTHALIKAVAHKAKDSGKNFLSVERITIYANKYDEIADLSIQFPQIAHLAPERPPIWMPEPKATIYFEALSMALSLQNPPDNLPI